MRNSIFVSLLVSLVACSPAAPKKIVSTEEPVHDAEAPPATTITVEEWRVTPPKPTKTPEFATPVFAKKNIENGFSVYVVERHGLPIVAVGVALRNGSSKEAFKKSGVADFTYEMMLEGADGLNGVALAKAFADLGTEAAVMTKQDGAVFHSTVLKKNLEPCLSLLKKVITKPTFNGKDFKRKKGERLADLDRMESSPRYLSQIALAQEVFGPTHPYGRPVLGTNDTVSKFKLKDVKKFYKNALVPGEMALILAGDVTVDEAVEMAKKHFGKLKKKRQKGANVPVVDSGPRTEMSLVAKPGLNQTIIAMGRSSIKAGDEKEWAYRLASNVFGEMFGSRLNMKLREEKGYTYGARSWVSTDRYMGSAGAFSAVKADVTGAALKEFFGEMEGMVSNEISLEEFEDARENSLKSWVGWFETVGGLSTAAENLFFRELPLDRYTKMVEAYKSINLDEVRAAAKELFVADNMKVVLVGDPGTVEAQVGEFKLGTVKKIDPTVLTTK